MIPLFMQKINFCSSVAPRYFPEVERGHNTRGECICIRHSEGVGATGMAQRPVYKVNVQRQRTKQVEQPVVRDPLDSQIMHNYLRIWCKMRAVLLQVTMWFCINASPIVFVFDFTQFILICYFQLNEFRIGLHLTSLFQVDARSYLLDFKCIDDTKNDSDSILNRRRSGNVSMCFEGNGPGEYVQNIRT